MRNLLAVGVVVALVAGAIWWLCSLVDARPPQPEAPPAAQPGAVTAVPAPVAEPVSAPTATNTPDAAAPVERTEAPRVDATQPEHTLRGRAVDASGQPLAGIDAWLIGWTGNNQRLAAWTKNNPEPNRIDQKVTTGPDGVFTFRCWPPPPFQFLLRLQGSGVATWSQRWSEWTPGGTMDLGDVKLERGTLLRGRVVDSVGAPVAKVEVRVDGAQRGAARDGGFETWCAARTGDDGAFVQRWPLMPGDYTIGIDDQIIERGGKVTLTGEPEQVIDVVCKLIDSSDVISGVVVDESGAPIRGATVYPNHAGTGRVISTDAQGRFRVLKREDSPAEIELSARARGYEAPKSQEKYAWGRNDVRIVMTRGNDLTVFAVRAADGTPVENYLLRVIPLDGGWSSMDREPRGKPPHKEGRANVAGIRAGKHRVVVEPQGDDLAIGVLAIEVGANGAAPVTVRLAATLPRTVRVVVADGTPVAGAKVQLVDPCGEPWNKDMPVYGLASQTFSSGAQGLELAVATTGASGDCTLPVPGDRPLALMLPGPGHSPVAVQPATFPADGPLVVTVSKGAVLRGQLGPEAAWAVMKGSVGDSGRARPGSSSLPTVQLHRGEGRASETFPDFRSRHTVNADGSFELTGIPPGRWNAFVQYFTSQGGGHGFGDMSKQEPIGAVDLVDGQVTTITPDLSALLPGTLEALVVHGGAPLANTLVQFERIVPGAQWPQHEASLQTDAEGCVRAALRGGEYRVMWHSTRSDGSFLSTLRGLETAVVRVGETTRQTFTIQSGAVRARLVDARGEPVASVHVGLVDAAGAEVEGLGTTGADGRLEKRCTPGTFTATVLPKRLQDQKALMEFYHTVANDPAAVQRVRIQIGTITVVAGESNEFELKLPADW